MPIPVRVSDIVEALECISDTRHAFVHGRTGEIVLVSDDDLRVAESDDAEVGADDTSIEQARAVLRDDGYLELPTRFDLNEYSIMQGFSRTLVDATASGELTEALRGRGAFRAFKDAVLRLGLEDKWYEHRRQALEEIAADWLAANGNGSKGRGSAKRAP